MRETKIKYLNLIIWVEVAAIILLGVGSAFLLKDYKQNKIAFLKLEMFSELPEATGYMSGVKEEMPAVADTISEEVSMDNTPAEETLPEEVPTEEAVPEEALPEGAIREDGVLSDGEINIAVLGDSIWDFNRNDNSVAEQLEQMLETDLVSVRGDTPVNIYNLATGGTCAAAIDGSIDLEAWSNKSLAGVVYIIEGKLDPARNFSDTNMIKVLPQVDFERIDYFIYSYGLNDYFYANPVYGEGDFDLYSYTGSLSFAVSELKKNFPDSRHIIISPTYCQFYYYDEVIDTCLDRRYYKGDFQGDTLDVYVQGAYEVAQAYDTLYLDAFNDFGLGADSQKECSRDGVHFNTEGRRVYAANVSKAILRDME